MTDRSKSAFSQAQMYALSAMADGRVDEDQTWIRPNTLASLAGLWWQQDGALLLTPDGVRAFESAGGYEATWK